MVVSQSGCREATLSDVTVEQLTEILSGDPDELDVHLTLVQRDIQLPNSKVTMHCHCLAVDANGRIKLARLAEFMRTVLTDYSIPRAKLAAANARDKKFASTGAVTRLHYEAKALFTDLATTG